MSGAAAAAPETHAAGSPLHALRWHLTLLLIGAAVLPMTIVSLGGWVVFRGLIADRVAEHLQLVVHDHAANIDLFLQERLKALRLISESYSQAQLADPAVFQAVFATLNKTYDQGFLDLSLVNDQGRHVSYIGPYKLLHMNYRDAEWFRHVRDEGEYTSDVFLGFRKVPHFIMAVRHDEGDGRFWVLRASINSEVFEELVSREVIGSGGDCYLLDKTGRYQTRPKHNGEVLTESGMTVGAPREGVWTVRARSADGRPIVRTMQWIKGGQWLLVAERGLAEVEAPINRALARGTVVFALGVLTILVVTSLITGRLFRMLLWAEQQKERLDDQFLRAAKLASVGEMATGVAHEINNPLGIIYSEQTNIADLLQEMDSNDLRVQEMRESVAQTSKQVARCKAITHKLLQFGRKGVATGSLIDTAAELAEIVRFFERQASVNNISLGLELKPGLPKVLINAGEFQQVVSNLLTNSLQALQGRRGAIRVSAWSENGNVMVSVEDDGPGIPRALREKIFEPFYTTKQFGQGKGGTGLGLSVCYGIVSKWKGRIFVDPIPVSGARLIIELPAAPVGGGSHE
jgi:two-component system NtrC family sensor kinase